MNRHRRIIQLLFIFLGFTAYANAQVQTQSQAIAGKIIITGTVVEKANLELYIYKKVDKKIFLLADYKTSPNYPEFVFVLPVDSGARYELAINRMKQGHLRLETEKRFMIPLNLQADRNISMRVTPSTLDTIKKTGIAINDNSTPFTFSLVHGSYILGNLGGQVSLNRVEEGKMVTVTSYHMTKGEDKFQLAIPVKEEGIYYLTSSRTRSRIYLKPADQLFVNIDGKRGYFTYLNGSRENWLMEKWNQLSRPITDYGYYLTIFQNDTVNLEKYANTYKDFQRVVHEFKSNNALTNAKFNKLFWQSIDLDNQYAPIYLWSCLEKKNRNKKPIQPPPFLNSFVGPGKFNNAALLEMGEGMDYMNLYAQLELSLLSETERKSLSKAEGLERMMESISNDTLKAYYLKYQLETYGINNLSEFREIFEPYKSYAKNPVVNASYKKTESNFIGDTIYIGKSSYNFSLPDANGKIYSMKDFKGKIVFIDVWATWCGPCKGEFPHLKDLEAEYHDNKDIVFVSISIDMASARQKWINTIQTEGLPGIQLLDDRGKNFGAKYDIAAIPRFLLIDREGKWIEIKCPRPSSKEDLKRLLDRALKEGSVATK